MLQVKINLGYYNFQGLDLALNIVCGVRGVRPQKCKSVSRLLLLIVG